MREVVSNYPETGEQDQYPPCALCNGHNCKGHVLWTANVATLAVDQRRIERTTKVVSVGISARAFGLGLTGFLEDSSTGSGTNLKGR
jgi:hypothetical protein